MTRISQHHYLLLALLTLAFGINESAHSQELAVLGFESEDVIQEDSRLLNGLSDLLTFSLADRGAELIERQDVNELIGERRLFQLLGEELPSRNETVLPNAALLIRGKLQTAKQSKIAITIEVTRASDGSLVQRVELQVDSVKQLADGIALAAKRIDLEGLPASDEAFAPRRIDGFTENPEAALLFYRGIEYLAANRVALAVAYFDEASLYDAGFYVAQAWQARALQRAGLTDFAHAVVEEVDYSHREPLRKQIALIKPWEDGDRLTVAVSAAEGHDAITRVLEEQWSENEQLRVLAPGGLIGATAEQDLKLSGAFAHLPAVIDRWLFADIHVRVALGKAHAFDVRSGRQIASVDLDQAADPLWLIRASRSVDKKPEQVAPDVTRTAKKSITIDPLRTVFRDPAGLETRPPGTIKFEPTRIQETSALLQRVLDEPENLTAWWAVAALSRPWATAPACDRMVHLIDQNRDIPDAAAWLSTALFKRYEWDFHREDWPAYTHFGAGTTEPDTDERARKLLEWFPESEAAQLLQYTRALELATRGKHIEAIAQLKPLAQRLPDMTLPGDKPMSFGVAVNVYFQLARECAFAGKANESRKWLDRCIEAASEKDWRVPFMGRMNISCYPDRHLWFISSKAGHAHRDTVDRRLTEFTDLRPLIRDLDHHLNRVQRGEVEVETYQGINDLHVAVVGEMDPRRRFDLQARSVEAWLAQRQEKTSTFAVPDRVMRQLSWLRIKAITAQDNDRVDSLIIRTLGDYYERIRISSNFSPSSSMRTLMLLAGLDSEIERALAIGLDHKKRRGKADGILNQIEFNSLDLPPSQQADQLIKMIRDYEVTYRDEIATGSTEYLNLVEQVGPVLMERGRLAEAIELYQHIIDNEVLPWVYRDRARGYQALAIARQGEPHVGAETLSDIAFDASTRSAEVLELGITPQSGGGHWAFQQVWPKNANDLAHFAQHRLHRLRLFAGRIQTNPHYVEDIIYDPLHDDDPYAQAKLVAFTYLLNVPRYRLDYTGAKWWSSEASRELYLMDDRARPYLQRLLWSCSVDRTASLRQRPQAKWFALMHLGRRGPDWVPDRRLLLDWLVWSPVCEVKYHSVNALRAIGAEGPEVLTTLVLAASMTDGCQYTAREALRTIAQLDEAEAGALADLLDHPIAEARQYAAATLARHTQLDLEHAGHGLPDDQAVAMLKGWWSGVGKGEGNWPREADPTPILWFILEPNADRFARLSSGSELLVGSIADPTREITLDHGTSAWVDLARFSFDGRFVATYAQDHHIRVWDLEKPDQPVLKITPKARPYTLALGHDGRYVAYYDQSYNHVVDIKTGETLFRQLTQGAPGGSIELVGQESNFLLATTGYDSSPVLYDIKTGVEIGRVAGTQGNFYRFKPMGPNHVLTTARDGQVRVWQLTPKLDFQSLDGVFDKTPMAAPSPDGRAIVAINALNEVGVWDAKSGKLREIIGHVNGKAEAIGWPVNTGPLVVLRNNSVLHWDAEFVSKPNGSLLPKPLEIDR